MVELFSKEMNMPSRQSSKGNQLKWRHENNWYKADYAGYEGLSEYVVSELLAQTGLEEGTFVRYTTEEIMYHERRLLGCVSENFLPPHWQLLTLERLYRNQHGASLNQVIYSVDDIKERIRLLVLEVERLTNLTTFGPYLARLLTIDAFFLNEDRHMHNIAVLLDPAGEYHLCPFFDHGASLLSDTTLDYPMDGDVYRLMDKSKPKSIARDHVEILEAVEQLYGITIRFPFRYQSVASILEAEQYYDKTIKKRVEDVVMQQIRRYEYLTSKH